MATNMGTTDRALRLTAAAALLLYLVVESPGPLVAALLAIVSLVFIVTSFVGYCPLYAPFGWSTRGR